MELGQVLIHAWNHGVVWLGRDHQDHLYSLCCLILQQRTSRAVTSPSRTAGMSSVALVLEWEWLLGALAGPGKNRNGIILAAAGGGFLLSGCSSP